MRIQITFSKQGSLRYTGHLDLHKLWERAARRAELPLAYSQGFHPQPKMNIAAALPLGFSSRCEVLDMRLKKEYDLRPLIEELYLVPENMIYMKLTAKEGATGRPEEVLDELGIAFEETRIERTCLNFRK